METQESHSFMMDFELNENLSIEEDSILRKFELTVKIHFFFLNLSQKYYSYKYYCLIFDNVCWKLQHIVFDILRSQLPPPLLRDN